jgi:hypothetical protein
MEKLEVFEAPFGLEDKLNDFFKSRDIFELSKLQEKRVLISQYVGVYSLFYKGKHSIYQSISTNMDVPIYIGKAIPEGARTGVSSTSQNLYKRLNEHKNSIRKATNLVVEDFYFKVIPLGNDLVSWAEACLIRSYKPIWNTIIPGFGIHAPGKGRQEQERSVWDQLHPGRGFATKLPVFDAVDSKVLEGQIKAHIVKMTTR